MKTWLSEETIAIAFTVYGLPVPKGSANWIRSATTGKSFPKSNAKLEAWAYTVNAEAARTRSQTGWPLLTGPVALDIRFYMPRAKSAPKRVTEHTKRPDIDKLTRAVLDALTKVIYDDDSQVTNLHASKHYGDPPRLEVEVSCVAKENA